jgi:signal transduction histidine kinase
VAVAGAHVEIRVSDSGIGIPAGELPFILDRFRQVENQASAQGLGLGLAIVREIVKGHDGTVSATSGGEQAGSTFCITLPVLTTA